MLIDVGERSNKGIAFQAGGGQGLKLAAKQRVDIQYRPLPLVLETWLVEGCWFKSVDPGDLNYDDDSPSTLAVVVRFDHARLILTGQGYGTALGGNL